MSHFPVPIVVVSKCLGYAPCRWDGDIVKDDFVGRLGRHARIVPVCPEMEIGLGVPREKIRLVGAGPDQRLVQPATGRDLTGTMQDFAAAYLAGLGEEGVDGFILKSRSPSCGITDAKIFPNGETEEAEAFGVGVFGRAVMEKFTGFAVEDETRLVDTEVRRTFLVRLFERARIREGKGGTGPDPPFPPGLL